VADAAAAQRMEQLMSATLLPSTIFADHIFDGDAFQRGTFRIRIAAGAIASMERVDADASIPTSRGVVDLRGRLLMPGLINSHVHLARAGMFKPLEPLSIGTIAENLVQTLQAGVTTAGEMGCAAPLAAAMRELVGNDGLAPSIRCAGPLVTAPGSYPLDWLPPMWEKLGLALPCSTEREGEAAVQHLAEAGMDHVKLAVMHKSYREKPLPRILPEVARAICREAHKLGMRVCAHAHWDEDYRFAIDAGVDALMHSSFDPLSSETVARVRDSGVSVCPTLWIFESVCSGAEGCWWQDDRYAGISPAVRRDWKQFGEAYAESGAVLPENVAAAGGLAKARVHEGIRTAAANLMLLADAGVPFGFGNDAAFGYCVHARPVDELAAMQRAGLSAAACLHAATAGAARLLGCPDRGRLAPGQRADLIAVDGDPSRDLASMERISSVFVAGQKIPARTRSSARARAAIVGGLARTAVQAARGVLRGRA
jgi:imidazolonepropionase-like amidohydrolase